MFYKKGVILFILMLFIILVKVSFCKIIYKGSFKEKISIDNIKSGKLLKEKKDIIVVYENKSFYLFKFINKDFKLIKKIKINTNIQDNWDIGDFNNDGKDEILYSSGKFLKTISYNGKNFIYKKYYLNYYIDDIVIGDINNDKKNEIILFTYKHLLKENDAFCNYNLYILKFKNSKFYNLYNDNGKLGFKKSNIITSDYLICVGDIENYGYNELLAAKGQSDVSPTNYILLRFKNNKLKIIHRFNLEIIIDKNNHNNEFFAIGKVKPIKQDNLTMLIANMISLGKGKIKEKYLLAYIQHTQDHYLEKEFSKVLKNSRNNLLWVNIDGKGKGVLKIYKIKNKKAYYIFYRLRG